MRANGIEFDLKSRLIEKSIEAYVLALETINRLTIQYRLETFCFLFCNAWELLLKAKIIDDTGGDESIFYQQHRGQTKRTHSLGKCLNAVFPNQKHVVRRNITRIEELRDESVHLVISRIPRDVICLLQAGVVNYNKHLNQWFGESLSNRFPVGMMSIVFDMSPEQSDMGDSRLQQQLGPEAATFLMEYCDELRHEFDQLQQAPEFSIQIECRLVLTKRQDDADISLTSGPKGAISAQVVETPRDPGRTHPFRQGELVLEVKTVLQTDINVYDIQCIDRVYKIKSKREFYFQGMVKGSPGQYSHQYVDWISDRLGQDDSFFTKTRAKAREIKKTRLSLT